MSLYNLSTTYAQLQDMLENEEVTIEQIADTIEALQDSIGVKFENISKFIKYLDGKRELFKKEEDRLKVRRLSMESKTKWLKEYMLTNLDVMGVQKIDAGTYTIRKQKNQSSLLVTDQTRIPLSYLIPQEPKVDIMAIKEALKNGEKIDGVEIAPTSYHIRIQ